MKLVGPWYGVEVIKQYKKPDVKGAKIFNEKLDINDLSIRKRDTGEVYVYHSFYTKDRAFSGRWYQTDTTKDDFEWNNEQKKIIYKIPEWEISEDNHFEILKDVPITVLFTERGWKRLVSVFN